MRVNEKDSIRNILFTVMLPPMFPSIVAAALPVSVAAMSCYGIWPMIGTPDLIYTVTLFAIVKMAGTDMGKNNEHRHTTYRDA